MGLGTYKQKRHFQRTPEPSGTEKKRRGTPKARSNARSKSKPKSPIFVVQEHHASRLHWDLRLEAEGVLKSWAVPKGPSMNPADKRLAVEVEDHPLSYATFHGDIPAGEYGAGHVEVWDHGTYRPLPDEDPKHVPDAIRKGQLDFELHGRKLKGEFTLVRTHMRGGKPNWLLFKRRDRYAKTEGGAAELMVSEEQAKAKKAAGWRKRVKQLAAAEAPAVLATGHHQQIEVTHPDKLMFPAAKLTKQNVLDYYRRIAHLMLPYLKDRPVTVERYPEGVGDDKPRFWQKNLPKYYPDWIARVPLKTEEGKPVTYGVINDLDMLLYMVNQNALVFHVYLSRVESLDHPDFVLFDLDPGQAGWGEVVKIARRLHEELDGEGMEAFAKTTGKSGLHVMTPWGKEGGYDEARAWAEEVAKRVVKEMPEIATMERGKAKRGKRVYVDVVQNALGHHVVAPYSLRATEEATVSMPVGWEEISAKVKPGRWTVKEVLKRVATS